MATLTAHPLLFLDGHWEFELQSSCLSNKYFADGSISPAPAVAISSTI